MAAPHARGAQRAKPGDARPRRDDPQGRPAVAEQRRAGAAARAPRRGTNPEGGRARSCVGCGERTPPEAVCVADGKLHDAKVGGAVVVPLVRLVASPTREVVVDAGDGQFGRGAYVHATAACVSRAARGGLARSLKGAPQMGDAALSAEALEQAILEAFDRRIEGLLAAARRARKLAFGADMVEAALRAGEASLVVIAADAAAAADGAGVRDAVRRGRAVSWGDKARLGALARGEGVVGVLGVTDTRIADAIREARVVMDSVQIRPSADRPRNAGALPRPARAASEAHGSDASAEDPTAERRRASILDEGTASLPGPVLEGDGEGSPASPLKRSRTDGAG